MITDNRLAETLSLTARRFTRTTTSSGTSSVLFAITGATEPRQKTGAARNEQTERRALRTLDAIKTSMPSARYLSLLPSLPPSRSPRRRRLSRARSLLLLLLPSSPRTPFLRRFHGTFCQRRSPSPAPSRENDSFFPLAQPCPFFVVFVPH